MSLHGIARKPLRLLKVLTVTERDTVTYMLLGDCHVSFITPVVSGFREKQVTVQNI